MRRLCLFISVYFLVLSVSSSRTKLSFSSYFIVIIIKIIQNTMLLSLLWGFSSTSICAVVVVLNAINMKLNYCVCVCLSRYSIFNNCCLFPLIEEAFYVLVYTYRLSLLLFCVCQSSMLRVFRILLLLFVVIIL